MRHGINLLSYITWVKSNIICLLAKNRPYLVTLLEKTYALIKEVLHAHQLQSVFNGFKLSQI